MKNLIHLNKALSLRMLLILTLGFTGSSQAAVILHAIQDADGSGVTITKSGSLGTDIVSPDTQWGGDHGQLGITNKHLAYRSLGVDYYLQFYESKLQGVIKNGGTGWSGSGDAVFIGTSSTGGSFLVWDAKFGGRLTVAESSTWAFSMRSESATLSQMFGETKNSASADLLYWSANNGNADDQILWNFSSPVPEPTSSLLIGLGGLALIKRRSR